MSNDKDATHGDDNGSVLTGMRQPCLLVSCRFGAERTIHGFKQQPTQSRRVAESDEDLNEPGELRLAHRAVQCSDGAREDASQGLVRLGGMPT